MPCKLGFNTCEELFGCQVAGFYYTVVGVLVIKVSFEILIYAVEVSIEDFVILSSWLLTLLDSCSCYAVKVVAVFCILVVVRYSNPPLAASGV